MSRNYTKQIVLNALMVALVFLVTKFTSIPGPVGYFNIGDVAIMTASFLLGGRSGFIAGAVGSCLADIASGYMIFAPVTFFVKGLEGYVTGVIIANRHDKKDFSIFAVAAVISGAVTMVCGYFLSELYILAIFDQNFGLAAAVKDLVPNLVQAGIGAAVSYMLIVILSKSGLLKYIKQLAY